MTANTRNRSVVFDMGVRFRQTERFSRLDRNRDPPPLGWLPHTVSRIASSTACCQWAAGEVANVFCVRGSAYHNSEPRVDNPDVHMSYLVYKRFFDVACNHC